MILQNKVAEFKAEEKKTDELKKRIERMTARYDKRWKKSNWIKDFLEPFAEQLRMKLGYAKYAILGPFGIGCETSIWFYNTDEDYKKCYVTDLTLMPDFFEESNNPCGIIVKNYKDVKQNYAENTIGALNGGNVGNVIPPADADLDWFCEYLSWDRDKVKEADGVYTEKN